MTKAYSIFCSHVTVSHCEVGFYVEPSSCQQGVPRLVGVHRLSVQLILLECYSDISVCLTDVKLFHKCKKREENWESDGVVFS